MIRDFMNTKKLMTTAMVITALSVLSSCADSAGPSAGGGTTCTKCIDNKPPATPFSTTLNGINHAISLTDATAMIDNFGSHRDAMLMEEFKNKNTLPVYETFNLKAIDSLICQKNAIGFRIYMAMDNQQQVRMVLVGVDGDGKDIIQRTKENPGRDAASLGDASVLIDEAGQRWP